MWRRPGRRGGSPVGGGRALVNGKTATINGGTVRVTEPGGIAVWNLAALEILGGAVGRVELAGIDGISQTTFVYGQAELPAEPTGVPVLIGDSGYRIAVTLPSADDITDMLGKVALVGGTLPDENDPFS